MSQHIELTEEEQRKRKSRNKALAWVLFGLVIIFYLVSVFKMGPDLFRR